jgi:hypothetical protein
MKKVYCRLEAESGKVCFGCTGTDTGKSKDCAHPCEVFKSLKEEESDKEKQFLKQHIIFCKTV